MIDGLTAAAIGRLDKRVYLFSADSNLSFGLKRFPLIPVAFFTNLNILVLGEFVCVCQAVPRRHNLFPVFPRMESPALPDGGGPPLNVTRGSTVPFQIHWSNRFSHRLQRRRD